MPKPAHFVVRHKAAECIGCCACAEIVPHIFEMDDDGMAVLVNAVDEGVMRSAEIPNLDRSDVETAVDDCPVDIIRAVNS